MTDLQALLAQAADDLVPERDPLGGHLDGVRRLVRRRRAIRRVQAGAGAVVGVAAIGTATLWTLPGPVTPAVPAAWCGEPAIEVLPAPGELDGFATLQVSDGMSLTMRAQLENLGDAEATTADEVVLVVSLQGTGEVIGYAAVTLEPVTIAPGTAGDVLASATLESCARAGVTAGGPLPDGVYDLTLTGTATAADGTELPWRAATNGIRVTDGQVVDPQADGEPDGEATPAAAFTPICGDMIPAVAENPMWASTAASGAGPFHAGDPDEPYTDGLPLDLTIGTVSDAPLSGELSAEVVTVLTDLSGNVITWWRASEHGRPLDLGPALDLAAGGEQVFEGFAWFPVVDSCAGEPTPLPDGDYRLFTWAEVGVRAGEGDALETYPMVGAPLDVSVTDGAMSIG